MTLFTCVCVKRLIGWCMLCVWLLTFSVPLHDVCGVRPNPLSRTALMHLETAGEGPTNQVLQIHKSIASAKSIAIYVFYFAVILLLDWLMDVVLLFPHIMYLFWIHITVKNRKMQHRLQTICAGYSRIWRVSVRTFELLVVSLNAYNPK